MRIWIFCYRIIELPNESTKTIIFETMKYNRPKHIYLRIQLSIGLIVGNYICQYMQFEALVAQKLSVITWITTFHVLWTAYIM